MHALKRLVLTIAAASLAVPALAQVGGYESEQFISAVRKGDNDNALKLLQANPNLVNARDLNGNTALITAIQNRDDQWTAYLLKEGADPDTATSTGETPLMAAARVGYQDAADWLVQLGAKVDATNRMGETALIIAVQHRQLPIVRLLINAGADPDKTDSAQGYSARDYAKRDSRTPELLRIIEAKKSGR
jgi:ankyrin repeat protein